MALGIGWGHSSFFRFSRSEMIPFGKFWIIVVLHRTFGWPGVVFGPRLESSSWKFWVPQGWSANDFPGNRNHLVLVRFILSRDKLVPDTVAPARERRFWQVAWYGQEFNLLPPLLGITIRVMLWLLMFDSCVAYQQPPPGRTLSYPAAHSLHSESNPRNQWASSNLYCYSWYIKWHLLSHARIGALPATS